MERNGYGGQGQLLSSRKFDKVPTDWQLPTDRSKTKDSFMYENSPVKKSTRTFVEEESYSKWTILS